MDRFESLRTFVRVAETGSISQAASQLNVNKSVVSRRLRELENHLGVQLLRRTTRQVNLTESGRGFLQRVQRILQDLEEAEAQVGQSHQALRGNLKISVPLSFGLSHLAPALTDFMTQHPQLNLEIDLNDRQVDLMQEGFDMAIRIGDLSDSSHIAVRLAPIRSVACASPDYLDRHGTPRTPEDLAHHICLVYSNMKDPLTWHYRDALGKNARIKVPPRHRANNGDFIRQAAVAGFGIAILPTFIAWKSLEKGQLLPLLLDFHWRQVNAYAIYPQTRHLSRRVRQLVTFLRERFEQQPYWDRCLDTLSDPG